MMTTSQVPWTQCWWCKWCKAIQWWCKWWNKWYTPFKLTQNNKQECTANMDQFASPTIFLNILLSWLAAHLCTFGRRDKKSKISALFFVLKCLHFVNTKFLIRLAAVEEQQQHHHSKQIQWQWWWTWWVVVEERHRRPLDHHLQAHLDVSYSFSR